MCFFICQDKKCRVAKNNLPGIDLDSTISVFLNTE
jgi:hypothetical protein